MLLAEGSAVGMSAVVSAITTGITPTVMFGTLAEVVPVIVTIVPFALGLYFLRKLVKGFGKGKVRF